MSGPEPSLREPTAGVPSDSIGARLAALTPSGRARVPIAWAVYDFANTMFSFAVVSGAIGLWLTNAQRFGEQDGNVVLSVAVVVSVALNAIASPILGALSDRGRRRLPFLMFFTLLCIVPTAFIGPSAPALGLVLFIVANFAYQAALIYYDATLKVVSTPESRGRLSGIGVAIGYCGTIVIGLVIFFLDIAVPDRFPLTALLYGLFAVPIFLFVRESRGAGPPLTAAEVLGSWRQLSMTVTHARQVPGLGRFLLGRFFYSDAVNTIIVVMSVVSVKAMGLSEATANLVLLSLTVVAVLASVGWGVLVDRLGPKRTLMVVLSSWAVGLILGAISLGIPGGLGLGTFLAAGAILGSGLGGVQVADRVFMVRLSPPERLGEFFGLYGLVGKGSQVVGQMLYGLTFLLLFDALGRTTYQVAVVSLLLTMFVGLWLIWPVNDRWAGSGELAAQPSPGGPPERLAPGRVPLEPRA